MYLTLNSPRPLYSSVLYTIPLGHFGLPCGSTAGKESTCGSGDPGWEDLLEKGTATHSSILAWRIPWTEEPGGLQSMGSQRVRHD